MLNPEHIVTMRLSLNRLAAHKKMPPPAYLTKPLTSHMSAVGESVIAEMLRVPPDQFAAQLPEARDFGASYLIANPGGDLVGLSAFTSLINNCGNILNRHLIVPADFTRKHTQLSKHYVLGVFVRGQVVNGQLPDLNEVELAGWTDSDGLKKNRVKTLPAGFWSKLPVVLVPCTALHPMQDLLPKLREMR